MSRAAYRIEGHKARSPWFQGNAEMWSSQSPRRYTGAQSVAPKPCAARQGRRRRRRRTAARSSSCRSTWRAGDSRGQAAHTLTRTHVCKHARRSAQARTHAHTHTRSNAQTYTHVPMTCMRASKYTLARTHVHVQTPACTTHPCNGTRQEGHAQRTSWWRCS